MKIKILFLCLILTGCNSIFAPTHKRTETRIEPRNRIIETITTDFLYDYSFFFKGIGTPSYEENIIIIDTIIPRIINNKTKSDKLKTTINKNTNEIQIELQTEGDTIQSKQITIHDTIYVTNTEYVDETK